jgi:hypothetical protein
MSLLDLAMMKRTAGASDPSAHGIAALGSTHTVVPGAQFDCSLLDSRPMIGHGGSSRDTRL